MFVRISLDLVLQDPPCHRADWNRTLRPSARPSDTTAGSFPSSFYHLCISSGSSLMAASPFVAPAVFLPCSCPHTQLKCHISVVSFSFMSDIILDIPQRGKTTFSH